MPLSTAREALDRALADGGLVAESYRAASDGLAFVMPVGPGGLGPSRDVLVRVLPSRQVGQATVVPLRWEAIGPAAEAFPTLDANLTLTAHGADTKLSIIGSYRPPFGLLGTVLDRTVMSKVAVATVRALVCEVAAHLREIADPPAGAET